MTIIDRKQLIAEELIREHVRKRIKTKLKEQKIDEMKLRKVIRRLIETEAGTDEASRSTGINVLADLLEKIVPIIEDDYKMLTSSKEQRDSFRNHIIHAVENSLRPIESTNQGEQTAENLEYEIDADILLEKLSVNLDPESDGEEEQSVEGEFIDIEGEDGEEGSFVEIEDQNETGRNFAAVTFKAVEKQIIDAYDMLADEDDQNIFYDYLITNLLLYFDKFEDDLQTNLPDVSTSEYEEEKEEVETSFDNPEEEIEL